MLDLEVVLRISAPVVHTSMERDTSVGPHVGTFVAEAASCSGLLVPSSVSWRSHVGLGYQTQTCLLKELLIHFVLHVSDP